MAANRSVHRLLVALLASAFGVLLLSGACASAQLADARKDTTGALATGVTGRLNTTSSIQAWEELVAGGPATNSTVINGCMRGGTCTVLDTYTGTTSAVRFTQGLYDYFTVVPTLTGGASPTVTANLTGLLASIPSPYLWWSSPAGNTASGAAFVQNVASDWVIMSDKRVVGATRLQYNVGTIDNTANLYNLAAYDFNGNILAQCGATAGTTFANTATIHACVVPAFTWPIGPVQIVITTNCSATCAALNSTTAQWMYVANANVGATANAVLPNTITTPSSAYTQVNSAPSIMVR